MATPNRRIGAANADTRSLLLDVAERLMCEEGYASVTSRRLATAAKMSPQIVYYYFHTMDDLFEALFDRVARYHYAAIEQAADAPNPLVAIWRLSSRPENGIIISELTALANHRKGLKSAIADFGRRYHLCQTRIIEDHFARCNHSPLPCPPAILAAVLEAAARSFAAGRDFQIEEHELARDYVEDLLARMPAKANDAA